MFNAIFKNNHQEEKYPGKCVVEEPELHKFRKPKYAVHNEWNGHQNPTDCRNHNDGITLYRRISKGTGGTQNQNSAHPKSNE